MIKHAICWVSPESLRNNNDMSDDMYILCVLVERYSLDRIIWFEPWLSVALWAGINYWLDPGRACSLGANN